MKNLFLSAALLIGSLSINAQTAAKVGNQTNISVKLGAYPELTSDKMTADVQATNGFLINDNTVIGGGILFSSCALEIEFLSERCNRLAPVLYAKQYISGSGLFFDGQVGYAWQVGGSGFNGATYGFDLGYDIKHHRRDLIGVGITMGYKFEKFRKEITPSVIGMENEIHTKSLEGLTIGININF